MNPKQSLLYIFIFIYCCNLFAENNYLRVRPRTGDGIQTLFARYEIPFTSDMLDTFKVMNQGKLTAADGLKLHVSYMLPILIYKYNGKSIRSTIDNNDMKYAKRIQKYNDDMLAKRVKHTNYRIDKELWVPLFGLIEQSPEKPKTTEKKKLPSEVTFELFGDKYKNVKIASNKLGDCIFYIISGHGGPDPGAVGYRAGYELHEDEYAYDVSLRLARNLLEHGAEVYVIVQDSLDGIRDNQYLNNSYGEVYFDGTHIPANQLDRLAKRAEIINHLYEKNLSKGKRQLSIETHVDSRYTDKMIDIFFYYNDKSAEGKRIAEILLSTIEGKYQKAQPGRGYDGSVSSRNLYMLRNTKPTMIFIEIGNIQNPRDQIRLIEKNNRQAIANWLKDGLINALAE